MSSIKDLFKNRNIKFLADASQDTLGSEIESKDYASEYFTKKQRFIPPIDFREPANFVRFGSAEKYWTDAISRIYNSYPYDGSLKERLQWENSSSYLDLYVFEQEYPRTNGYIIFSADGWGTQGAISGDYGLSSTEEYILTKGGPNTSARREGYDIEDSAGTYRSGYANIYDEAKNRESNLKIGGNDGNTVEFWLKKSTFITSLTKKEVIFDLHTTSSISSSADYARLTIELTGATDDTSPFRFTYMSGTSGVDGAIIGDSVTTSSLADDKWHHYAFTFINSGSSIEASLYIDGACNHTVQTGSTIDYVSGALVSTIGALACAPSGTNVAGDQSQLLRGYGKLSGSIDEFRFWKNQRSSQQIGRYYFSAIGGGTNSDDANTHLGVYYKFNEGITGTSSVDQNILDYSGRISNGEYTGYASSARSTNSAIVEAKKAPFEFKDPILYSFHPDVKEFYNRKKEDGNVYDVRNNSSIYHSLPAWITEGTAEDYSEEQTPLRNLTQIIGSYFDSVAVNISALPTLKHATYLSSSVKPFSFADRLLESVGFDYMPELFSDASELSQYLDRDEKTLFTQKLYDTKNRIYQNIYNNITYIYKSKGTEKSFRNLIRCFGVDEDLYRINMYTNNGDYQLLDNYRSVSERKNYANFTLTGTAEATVHQFSSSTNSDSTSFISASNAADATYEGAGLAFTVEAEVNFPRRFSQGEFHTVVSGTEAGRLILRDYVPMISSSLFGCHRVDGTENDLTWNSTDLSNFQVFAVKDELFSKRCFFQLTGTSGGVVPNMASSYFEDVYDDNKWNFAVSVKPTTYPEGNLIAGSGDSPDVSYDIHFYGVEKVLDQTRNSFLVTASLTTTEGRQLISSTKSMFAGSHRTNFTGSTLQKSDASISSVRYWLDYLPTATIDQHAQDVRNYGATSPYKSAYLFQESMDGVRVPQIDTLALNWTFDTVTGSDASGQFIAQDLSSGSSDVIARYNWLGDVVGKQYLARGYDFPASFSGSINKKYIHSAKKQLPEVINSSDTVNIAPNDDVTYTRDKRPIDNFMLIEKSMYQTISQEIINMFATIKDFNNLIGEPVNMYRQKYKHMEKLRQLFFEQVGNVPDLDKYLEYYKWLDNTLNIMLGYLIPASSNLSANDTIIQTTVESHVLERNKYTHQYPTLEDRTPDPEGKLFGINELLYNWEFGHAPLDDSQTDNCMWWKDRAERDDALASGNSGVDADKGDILKAITSVVSASAPTLAESSSAGGIDVYNGSTYALRNLVRPYKLKIDEVKGLHGGINFSRNKDVDYFEPISRQFNSTFGLNGHGLKMPKTSFISSSCTDDSALNDKPTVDFTVMSIHGATSNDEDLGTGELFAPFNIVSSSVEQTELTEVNLVNIHHDTYGYDKEVPLQSPFTSKFVGGKPYRHTWNNFDPNSNNMEDRAEGWRIRHSDTRIAMLEPTMPPTRAAFDADLARSVFYRDETAKRPVNIRNIQQQTGSELSGDFTIIGNYTKDYEILQTAGRTINNRFLIEEDGLTASAVNSADIDGLVDYNLPGRAVSGTFVFVNRFASPGGPAASSPGTLDFEAAEYSVYNAMSYRNLAVRLPLQELLTDHCKQFGFFSDTQNSAAYALAGETYPGTSGSVSAADYEGDPITASFHKVNRNPSRRIKFVDTSGYGDDNFTTGTQYDNWYVQHQIPQTDLQYTWITASLIEDYSGSALYGFEQPDLKNASLASTDLTFCSSSDVGSYVTTGYRWYGAPAWKSGGSFEFIPVDFVGLNSNIYDPVTSSDNFLGYPKMVVTIDGSNPDTWTYDGGMTTDLSTTFSGIAKLLNGIICHRGGIYGWTPWKQIRGHQHPVVKVHRSENRISWMTHNLEYKDSTTLLRRGIDSQIEPPITSKYGPIRHNLTVKTNNDPDAPRADTSVDHSYGNQLVKFTDQIDGFVDLNSNTSFNFKNNFPYKTYMYDTLRYLIVGGQIEAQTNPVDKWKSIDIPVTVYPREKYTYLKTHRQRDNYKNNFWRRNREAKIIEGSQYKNLTTGLTPGRNQTNVNNSQGLATGSLGLSQSIWPLDGRSGFAAPPYTTNVTSLPELFGSGSEGELKNSYSLFHTTGSSTSPVQPGALYARRIAQVADIGTGEQQIGVGDTKWTAAEISGRDPFYKDYDSYVEEMKRYGKDYGIIPEFRISEHMDYYINTKKGDFLASNPGWLTLTGTTDLSSSNDDGFFKVYSHTDFLKYFNVVKNDYAGVVTEAGVKEISDAKSLTLQCNALVKLLPYDGFYPADRSVELVSLFSQSYADGVTLRGSAANMRTLLTPLFAPGILYNTVKSGLAVDYPLFFSSSGGTEISGLAFTGSHAVFNGTAQPDRGLSRIIGTTAVSRNSLLDNRAPFEALVEPEAYLANKFLVDMEPHSSASIQSTASMGSKDSDPLYKLAMHNFLAETVNFFLQNGSLTTISSAPEAQFKPTLQTAAGTFKEYRMRIVCSHAKYRTRAGLQAAAQDLKDTSEFYGLTAPYSMYGYSNNEYNSAINVPTISMYERTGTFQQVGASAAAANLSRQYWGLYKQPRYGSSFGPPIDCVEIPNNGISGPTYIASWEPFTPPYYDGYSEIEIAYTPTVGTEQPSIEEILANSVVTYDRETSIPHIAPTSILGNWWANTTSGQGVDVNASSFTAHTGAMQLSSSLNWDSVSQDLKVIYDPQGNPVSVGESQGGPNNRRWVIQPKFECPVLDFSNAGGEPTTYAVELNGATERQVRGWDRGMWQQYGEVVAGQRAGTLGNNKGIVIQVQDLHPSEMSNPSATGSLRDLCGFSAAPYTIGNVADEKVIKEAVVAVPFFRNNANEQKRYTFDRRTINAAELILDGQEPIAIPTSLRPGDDVIEMVRRMREFIIPPQLDFLRNKSIKPFAMYIFPFEVKLSQQDLADIWQNLSPEISTSFQAQNASMSHDIFTASDENNTGMLGFLDPTTQWMVFKVKQQGKTNYYELTADAKDDERFRFRIKGEQQYLVPQYSYNWPYDFCSLVELIKLDTNIKVAPSEDAIPLHVPDEPKELAIPVNPPGFGKL